MSWEGIAAIAAIASVVIGALINAVTLAYFAGKFVSKMDAQTEVFAKFEKTYEKQVEDSKSSQQVMWNKIDDNQKRISAHDVRIKVLESR